MGNRSSAPDKLGKHAGRFILNVIPTYESGEWITMGKLCELTRESEVITDAEAMDNFRRHCKRCRDKDHEEYSIEYRLSEGRRQLILQKVCHYLKYGLVEQDDGRVLARRFRKTQDFERIRAEHKVGNQKGRSPEPFFRYRDRVAVSVLRPHPRNFYGADIDESFLDDIRNQGMIDPLTITKDDVIISGHRRWLAAKHLGMSHVRCQVVNLSSQDDAALRMMVSANHGRTKSHWDISEEVVLLLEIESRQARERKQEAGRKHGRGRKVQEPVPEPIREQARDRVAQALGVSGKTVDCYAQVNRRVKDLLASGKDAEAEALRSDLNARGPNPVAASVRKGQTPATPSPSPSPRQEEDGQLPEATPTRTRARKESRQAAGSFPFQSVANASTPASEPAIPDPVPQTRPACLTQCGKPCPFCTGQ